MDSSLGIGFGVLKGGSARVLLRQRKMNFKKEGRLCLRKGVGFVWGPQIKRWAWGPQSPLLPSLPQPWPPYNISSSSAHSVIQSLGPKEAPGGQCLHLKRQTSSSGVPGGTVSVAFPQRLPRPLADWQATSHTWMEPLKKIKKGEKKGRKGGRKGGKVGSQKLNLL